MKPKTQIVVPMWPNSTQEQQWGSVDYTDTQWGDSTSTWISLREKRTDFEWTTEYGVAVRDMGVYVWMAADGCISIDIRAQDIRSATVFELERKLKLLKSLRAKAAKTYALDTFTRDSDIFTELTKFFDALGVKESVVYSGNVDTHGPIGLAIRTIATSLEARLERIRQRKAA